MEKQFDNGLRCGAEAKMTLTAAKVLANLIEKKADAMGLKVVVSITDSGANRVLTERMDGAFIASIDIAEGKAYTCASLKMSTLDLKPLAQPGGSLYGIQFTNNGKIVIFGGGVSLTANGKVIGGLGISGGTEEEDTALADYGKSVFEEVLKCL